MILLIIGLSLSFIAIGVLFYLGYQKNKQIENIRSKMGEIKNRNQERIVFGPNVKQPQQQGYVNNPPK